MKTKINSQSDKVMDPYNRNRTHYKDANLTLTITHKQLNTHSTHRTIKVKQIKHSGQKIKTFNVGFEYLIGKTPKNFMNALIIDTENGIKHLDTKKKQNTVGYLAARKIINITETNTNKTLYKRQQYNIKQMKTLLEQNNLTIAKADKSRTRFINHKDTLKKKIRCFHTRKIK